MKKLFALIIICIIFIIGTVSGAEFDNRLNYEQEDMKVTLKNWFGLTELGTVELKSHISVDYVKPVEWGKQVVMYYDISFKDIYYNGLGDIEFTNLHTGELVDRDYKYVYFGEESYEVNLPTETLDKNGTVMKLYSKKILTRNTWLPYNSNDIPVGDIRLGIEVDVLPRDYIDAVWTIGGQKIEKHAAFLTASVTNTDNSVSAADSTNYLFSAQSIGTADPNRMVVVGAMVGQVNNNIDSVTIGTENATRIVDIHPATATAVAIWAIELPTGTTVDIWVNTSGANGRAAIGVWSVIDANVSTLNSTASANNGGNITSGFDVPANGIAIGYAAPTTSGGNNVWFGLTERFDVNSFEGSTSSTGADGTFVAEQSNLLVGTVDTGGFSAEDGSVFASWQGLPSPFPTVTLVSPGDETNSSNSTITFNGTIIDNTPLNVTLFINDVGNQTNTTGILDHYQFNVTLPIGNHTWNYQACNTNGCANETERTVNILKFVENAITFNENALEGSSQLFTLNLSAVSESLSSAQLIYEGTFTTTNIFSLDGFQIINDTITVPTVTTDTNKTVVFQLNFVSGAENTTSQNQTVQNFATDNCTANTNVLYNFTIVDEASKVKLVENESNTTGRVELNVWNIARTTSISNFSTLFNQTNPFAVCLNSSLSGSESYVLDAQIEYDADDYAKEFYNFQNESLTSSTLNTNVTLFDLLDASNQVFRIIYKSASFLPVENALISIQRKYIDEGIFNVSEIPKTDEKGETVGNFVVDNVIYNIVVTKFGEVLATFNNIVAVCQTPLVTQCEIDLNAFSESIEIPNYENLEDFNFTLGYNETTRTVTSLFDIPSGSIDTILLNVTGEDALGTSVCTDTILSSSGTLTCTVPQAFGNSTITAKLYRNGNFQAGGGIKLDQDPSDIYGVTLTGLAIFLMLTLIGISISNNPVYTSISLLVGVGLLFGLNLVANNGFIGATATFLWFAIAIIIVLIKGARRN